MRIASIFIFCLFSFLLKAQSPKWVIYYDSASITWSVDWNKTIGYLKKSEEIALADLGIYDANYLTIINDLGIAHLNKGQKKKALDYLNKAYDLKNEVYGFEHPEIQKSLLNLANVHAQLYHDSIALHYYTQIEPLPQDINIYLSALDQLINLKLKRSPKEAELFFSTKKDELHILASYINSTDSLLLSLIQSKIWLAADKLDELDSLFAQMGKKILKQENLPATYLSRFYFLRGVWEKRTFRVDRAEIDLRKAMMLEIPGTELSLNILANLADTYHKTGDNKASIKFYREALGYCTENNNLCRSIKNNLAGSYLELDSLEPAKKLYGQLVADYENAKDSTYYFALFGKGLVLLKQGQIEGAKSIFSNAKEELMDSQQPSLHTVLYNNLGIIAMMQKDYSAAKEYFRAALSLKTALYGEGSIETRTLVNHMALISWLSADLTEAIDYFDQALRLVKKEIDYIFPSLTLLEQTRYYENLKLEFEKFYSIILTDDTSRKELLKRVYQHQINVKSLLFNHERTRSQQIANASDKELKAKYGTLKMLRKRIAIYQTLSLKNKKLPPDEISMLQDKIRTLEKEISVALEDTSKTVNKTWEEMQASLADDEAFINIIRFRKFTNSAASLVKGNERLRIGFTDSIYYAALITTAETTEGPDLVMIKYGDYLEARANRYLRNATRFDVVDDFPYNYYWKPIDDAIGDKKTIYISNDGIYHTLNIATMYDQVNQQFMIEKYEINYIINPGKKPNPIHLVDAEVKQIALFGNPDFGPFLASSSMYFNELPGTAIEIHDIEKQFKDYDWETFTYTQKNADKNILEKITAPTLLHIATHGFYFNSSYDLNAIYPLLNAGLAFANANTPVEGNSYGILTAYEASNLFLHNTKLVTLSACESGVGALRNGEGIYGLQRSFLTAGANQVITSLWKVDDHKTVDFMDYFYNRLLNGDSTHQAIRATQLHIKEIYPDPKDWGGFVLVNP